MFYLQGRTHHGFGKVKSSLLGTSISHFGGEHKSYLLACSIAQTITELLIDLLIIRCIDRFIYLSIYLSIYLFIYFLTVFFFASVLGSLTTLGFVLLQSSEDSSWKVNCHSSFNFSGLENGCKFDGQFYQPNDAFVTKSCKSRCRCLEDGNMRCSPLCSQFAPFCEDGETEVDVYVPVENSSCLCVEKDCTLPVGKNILMYFSLITFFFPEVAVI